jgi:hypothetical protein
VPHLFVAVLRAAALGAWTRFVPVALWSALTVACWPPAVFAAPLLAVACLGVSALVGGWRLSTGVAVAAAVAVVGGVLLLVPGVLGWTDASALGFERTDQFTAAQIVRFRTGPAGAGVAGVGLLLAAALPLVVATGARLAWAARATALVLGAFALAWLPGRLGTDVAVPAVEGVLVPAAIGVSLLVGLGVAAFVDELRRFHFGWRQLASVVAAVGLALAAIGLTVDAVDGRWRLPSRSWPDALGWTASDISRDGAFRVLWLGDADVLPADVRTVGDVGWSLTRNGGGDVRDLWAPAAGTDTLEASVALAAQGRTAHLGHLLAPAAVRFVAVVERLGPDEGRRATAPAGLTRGLVEQVDLALVQAEPGIRLYENTAWAPVRSVVDPDVALAGDVADPLDRALRSELVGAEPVRGSWRASEPVEPGTLLVAEQHDDGWRAEIDGERLARADGIPTTNAFVVPARGSVALHFDGGAWRGLLVVQLAAWALALAVLLRARRARGATA